MTVPLTVLDATEEVNYDQAVSEHQQLSTAFALDDQDDDLKDAQSRQKKKLASQVMIECIQLDRELGIDVLETLHSKWLAIMEHPDTDAFKSLDDYFAFRGDNVGVQYVKV